MLVYYYKNCALIQGGELVCLDIMRYYGLLIDAPKQACDFAGATKDCMFLYGHLHEKVSLWHRDGKEQLSAAHFTVLRRRHTSFCNVNVCTVVLYMPLENRIQPLRPH